MLLFLRQMTYYLINLSLDLPLSYILTSYSRVSGGNFTLPSLGTVLDSLPSHGSSYLTLLFIN